MKRTNSKTNFSKSSVLAFALVAAGLGFTVPAQATDGDKVSTTVAAVEQDGYFATAQEASGTSPQSDTTKATKEAERGAFADEPRWRRRVFEGH